MRQLHPRQSHADPEIEVVQRTGAHPNQDLIFAQHRIRNVLVLEDFRTAKLMDANCFHHLLRSSRSISSVARPTQKSAVLLQYLVELATELELQVLNIVVLVVEVLKLLQFVLKCPQGFQILPGRTAGRHLSIFEECVDERLTAALKLAVRDIELLLRVFAGLSTEQADEDIALANNLVVLVLRASLGHRAKKILPSLDLQLESFFLELVVLLKEVKLECVPVFPQLGGGGEKDAKFARRSDDWRLGSSAWCLVRPARQLVQFY